MSTLAPVVIFAYRRPDHLRNTLASLIRCEGFAESPVIVYCDGPRNADEIGSVSATHDVARSMLGDNAEYHFSEVNQGLSRSVIAGVSDVVNRFGRAIVLEDDLELNPAFLHFMNRALQAYACEENVYQVSGYMFDVPRLKNLQSALFLPFTSSWGWATWKRAWDRFDSAAAGWETLEKDRKLRRRFNLDGSYDYATMLLRQMSGLRDSWAVRWYWTVFLRKGLVLFPPTSLVRNMGFDGSGTHGRGLLRRFSANTQFSFASIDVAMPMPPSLDAALYTQVKRALWLQNGALIGSVIDKLRWWKTRYFAKR